MIIQRDSLPMLSRKISIKNPEVLEMFASVTGKADDPTKLNYCIIYPKYKKIEANVSRFLKLVDVLKNSRVVDELFGEVKPRIEEYVRNLRGEFEEVFSAPDLDRYVEMNFVGSPESERMEFGAKFLLMKNSNVVNTVIKTCSNLVGFRAQLEDEAKLSDDFLIRTTVGEVNPFHGLNLDFKSLYLNGGLTKRDKIFILLILSKTYTIGHTVYNDMTSPEFDVDEFVDVIRDSIGNVKHQLPRCDEALDKIVNSVHMLKENFNEYNRDSIASGNSMLILENFILDVSKKQEKTSPKVVMQFKRIINHYRKMAKEKSVQDPALRSLFNEVDHNMMELEKKSRSAEAPERPGGAEEAGPAGPVEKLADGVFDGLEKMTPAQRKRLRSSRNQVRREIEKKLGDGDEVPGPLPAEDGRADGESSEDRRTE